MDIPLQNIMNNSRVPLRERVNGEWTTFEALLFNLITNHVPEEYDQQLLFSGRLELTQALLDAYDSYLCQVKRPN